MADDAPLEAEVAAAAPHATKAKRTKVEKLTADLATAEGKLSKLQTQHKALEAACKLGRRKLSPDAVSKRDEAATKCEGQVKAAKALVAATLEQLNLAKADAEAKAAAAAAKAAAAAAKAEETKPFTTAAIITIVTLKLQLQHKFDNKSDKNEKVWETITKKCACIRCLFTLLAAIIATTCCALCTRVSTRREHESTRPLSERALRQSLSVQT